MARKLDALPSHNSRVYDWDSWLDGSPWELTAGEDFTTSLISFRAQAKQAGARRGLRVLTRQVDEKTIAIQAVPRDLQ